MARPSDVGDDEIRATIRRMYAGRAAAGLTRPTVEAIWEACRSRSSRVGRIHREMVARGELPVLGLTAPQRGADKSRAAGCRASGVAIRCGEVRDGAPSRPNRGNAGHHEGYRARAVRRPAARGSIRSVVREAMARERGRGAWTADQLAAEQATWAGAYLAQAAARRERARERHRAYRERRR